MSLWKIKRSGRGFVVLHGPPGNRVAAFPMIDRWYWWLFTPYLVFVGAKAVRNYRD